MEHGLFRSAGIVIHHHNALRHAVANLFELLG